LKVDVFQSRARKYESSLDAALDTYNIPGQVYHKLIENVNKNFESFHRYLNIRKRLLKLDTLCYHDIYAPVVENFNQTYSYDEASRLILKAFAPLGEDYTRVVQKAFSERWIDVYPAPAKRSGAYSSGSAYDVHPYILLNYNDQYNDVSTLAHELGHTMHSYLSNKNQPFPTADYSIFVAEVASTFNEVLLFQKVLDETSDEKARLSLLMSHLDGFKGTLFRQTQFAEFELKIHQAVESGKPLTGDDFTALYGEIIDKYYGTDKGVMKIDDLYKNEWTFIPHFYYNFYVYQYATSFTASIALAGKVLSNEKNALEKYLAFLSSGSSDYPVNLLKKAGVDMLTDDPFNQTMKAMNGYMDEVDKILNHHE
jgi:oligoendopeptidase F